MTKEIKIQIGHIADLFHIHPEQWSMFHEWLAEYTRQQREEAWAEGHKIRQRRCPDKCRCEAWSRSECACGKYGTGKIVSLMDNPYQRES